MARTRDGRLLPTPRHDYIERYDAERRAALADLDRTAAERRAAAAEAEASRLAAELARLRGDNLKA